MLKKNLIRTGLIGHGLLLLVPNFSAGKTEPASALQNSITTRVLPYWKDSLIIQPIMDPLSSLSPEDALLAPKILLNRSASKFVKSFLKKEDESLSVVKKRSEKIFRIIDEVFKQYGLPSELKYLAVIESDLLPSAISRVGAKGIWQLMPVTARELGLKVSAKYDERKLVYKSTVAAAKYLKSLYADFGDWLLVMAAYNGGPGTVYNAIKKSGTKNFWALQSFLPEESRGHVKRFIGTHYFFEGKGSMATMTKSETSVYLKACSQFSITIEAKQLVKDSTTVVMGR